MYESCLTVGVSKGGTPGAIWQAKLGDANKFYYDENLKKWVEGVDPAPESAPLPPPPTASRFTGTSPFQEEAHGSSQAVTSKPGTPPLAPIGGNHYSNRRQGGGVRSRYIRGT